MPNSDPVASVKTWVSEIVIKWNLCPFAKKELVQESILFCVSEADDEEGLLTDLASELVRLYEDESIETTILIHPSVLQDFDDYNQFLDLADGLLEQFDWRGKFQIASFHPHYRFAGTEADDPTNFTNRSPAPLLHILRESSLTRAVDSYDDVAQIPERNMERMREMGVGELEARWQELFD